MDGIHRFPTWGFFCQGMILKENSDKYLYIFLDKKTCHFIQKDYNKI